MVELSEKLPPQKSITKYKQILERQQTTSYLPLLALLSELLLLILNKIEAAQLKLFLEMKKDRHNTQNNP